MSDDGGGWLDRLRGDSGVDTDEIWSQVKDDKRTVNRKSQKLSAKADALREAEPNDVSDPQELGELAQKGAENAEHVVEGADLGLTARNEEALTEDETYEFVQEAQEGVEGLADSIDEVYESVIEYGNETYNQVRQLVEQDMGLGVDVDLPANMWADGTDIDAELSDLKSEYDQAKAHFMNEARFDDSEKQKAEEKAEAYEQREQNLEGSPFQEQYGEMAEKLEEKAQTDKPVTAKEKAEKAKAYSTLVQFTRDHLRDVRDTAQKLEESRDKSYRIAENLDTILDENGYGHQEA